jgi:hypothetical protein
MEAITLRADLTRGLTNAEIDANWNAIVGELNTKVTAAGARAAISVSGSLTYNSTTGVLGFTETPLTSGNIVSALGFTPYNNSNPSGFITSAALTSYLPLAGGTLSGALTVGGNIIAAANAGSSRIIGLSSGTNTTLVLQAGAVTGSGANIELTADKYAYVDADETRLRSNDASVTFLTANSTGLNVVTGALKQGGNQVLHAGNFGTYAAALSHTHSYAPLTGGGTSGSWPISVTGTAGGVAWSAVSGRPTGEPWFGTVSNCGGVSGGGYYGTGITGGMYLYDEGGNVRIGGTITLTACACNCNCSTCCFPLDTEVAMGDGSTKAVQDVVVGDTVLSPFGADVEVLSQIVCPVQEGEITYLVNGTTRMTREHLLRGESGWLAVDLQGYIGWREKQMSEGLDAGIDPAQLKQAEVGDLILTLNGLVKIESIERITGKAPETLMSLELTGSRSFFANGMAVESKTNQG